MATDGPRNRKRPEGDDENMQLKRENKRLRDENRKLKEQIKKEEKAANLCDLMSDLRQQMAGVAEDHPLQEEWTSKSHMDDAFSAAESGFESFNDIMDYLSADYAKNKTCTDAETCKLHKLLLSLGWNSERALD